MNIAHHAQRRHTSKAFDPSRTIPEATINELQTLLRFSPSSVNSQPWHFVLAQTDAGKARIAKATQPGYTYNESKIRNASHVLVLCARTGIDDAHLNALLDQEQQDGRFATPQARQGQSNSRQLYVNLHKYDQKDLQHWMEKQVYLALGTLLLGAATLEIDACPMEGFDQRLLDAELGLHAQGLTSVVLVALGYRSAEDFNAGLPKSRLPATSVFTVI
jgi:nitroreductase/dihydropteridine reductase